MSETEKIEYLGGIENQDKIGSFCGIWEKGKPRKISKKDAYFLLKHHGAFFKKTK